MPDFCGHDVEQANIGKNSDNQNVDVKHSVRDRAREDVETGSGDAPRSFLREDSKIFCRATFPPKTIVALF